MRMLTDKELTSEKGIPGSAVTKWRLRQKLQLFQARKIGSTNVNPEPLPDKYNAAIAMGRTAEEATLDAERHLAKLIALEDGHSEEEAQVIAEAHVTKLLATKAEREARAAEAMATVRVKRRKPKAKNSRA